MTCEKLGEGRRPLPTSAPRLSRRREKLSVPVTVRLPYSLSLRLRSRVPPDGVSAFIRQAIEDQLNSTRTEIADPAADQFAEEYHHDHS